MTAPSQAAANFCALGVPRLSSTTTRQIGVRMRVSPTWTTIRTFAWPEFASPEFL
jgi:hypothetical protein